jgi:hypothetical protein
MRGKVLVLFAIAALVAYYVGHHNTPLSVTASPPVSAKPGAFSGTVEQTSAAVQNLPTPYAKSELTSIPSFPTTKRRLETGLTNAAIAAIIVKESRDQYHAGGKPCACPDDTARNGSSCGGRSAYSRPGGAAPLCYPSDVTAAMIDSFRQRQALR